ncbi:MULTISPECIES: adenosylmethionine--8-amino-7-oxononanoate transaminase [unclassified Pseudoalteromonas]|uniref:adenosylmethionine--8-amino-7-oxononanoate transaminase n=1 Tax=Pseudoalteromonas TaxID=53246 RepID=UPI0015727074|nr:MULTISPECIES: adenosylmethionine--8-amino-7-oxononanoate transaminase [unclassified Pseudoalteromonas]MBR8844840.1 adenosylmethionine--8-amino-7-oxononanoate transaminase [Pseudoalteromonas sp. JC3]MCF7512924.1 adenosylmethionine--8-amino-7-oxononanoate transaminase [Pseudoalteromonas sp. L7]MCF7524964.1 adenosylmethionine--8-amino-7-oxononanoate transaminase [Pseudoalteromonas sp. L23]MCG7555976.1 adenosylmethionine--8-amino-7-oxononanoate transaminase [Pseudoalteromonas sp. Of11M-6]MCX276
MSNKQTIDIEFDRKHIWHPYTSMIDPLPVYPAARTFENKIELETGETLIDGMASWWSAVHGYGHPEIITAIKNQADTMSHVMFGGLTHQPAVELCKLLVELTPAPLNRVFLADGGSVSVEVAIKMAIQYWLSKGKKNKTQIMTAKKGYHGDTFAAMSVCDPVNSMHAMYQGFLPEQVFVDAPKSEFYGSQSQDELNTLETAFAAHHEKVAAFIIEPIVQNAGGMNFYHPEYLKAIRALCDKYEVLLILDEIATGFGRTGKMFACEHAGISPDIMCVGKALTGGNMTLAATLATEDVALGISQGEAKVLMHGPTFMGNPLACAAAVASLTILKRQETMANIERVASALNALKRCLNLNAVIDVRVLGAIGVVEVERVVDVAKIQKFFIQKGVWIRPFGKLIYIMPPYITSNEDIESLIDAIYIAIDGEHF